MEWGKICGWGYYMVMTNLCRKETHHIYKLTPRMACYGYQEGVQDSCQGDSGGLLVNKNNTLIGIVLWGNSCGEKNKPGVYTDAIYLRDWIKNKTGIAA